MQVINVDFGKSLGKIKPMHAVNNGPVYKFSADQRITNIDSYRAAGIPYARTHDSSACYTYGGEHTVDVHAIFPDFDANVHDPNSYDFTLTDEYLKVIDFSGTKVFYRLGSKIEHWPKKYGTLPPKDFQKWAEICEHIIRHYTEGWANGFRYDIEYWEIWNEPDSDGGATWGGTKNEFFRLYDVAAKHLKKCFPYLKIGGPALSTTAFDDFNWAEEFLTQLEAPLDFFSWHSYTYDPVHVAEVANTIRKLMDKCGYIETESILNEWNYVRGWYGDEWLYSLRTEKSLKGAGFIASTMLACQDADVDMLMYYDARPCGMNGMFSTDFVCDCLKGYYPFRMFSTLYQLGDAVPVKNDNKNLFAVAASGNNQYAVMLTYYSDDDTAEAVSVRLEAEGIQAVGPLRVICSKLDSKLDDEIVLEQTFYSDNFTLNLKFDNYTTYLVRISEA